MNVKIVCGQSVSRCITPGRESSSSIQVIRGTGAATTYAPALRSCAYIHKLSLFIYLPLERSSVGLFRLFLYEWCGSSQNSLYLRCSTRDNEWKTLFIVWMCLCFGCSGKYTLLSHWTETWYQGALTRFSFCKCILILISLYCIELGPPDIVLLLWWTLCCWCVAKGTNKNLVHQWLWAGERHYLRVVSSTAGMLELQSDYCS